MRMSLHTWRVGKKYSSSWESVSVVKKLQIQGLRIQFLSFNCFKKCVFVNSPLYMWTRRTPCRRHKWKGPAWINLWIIQQCEWCLTMRVGDQQINIWFKDDVSSTSFYTGENHRPRLKLLTSRLKNTTYSIVFLRIGYYKTDWTIQCTGQEI